MTLKICIVCKIEFPLNNFRGKSAKCYACMNAHIRKLRALNKEEINKKNRESYYRNKPQRRINQKKYEQKKAILERTDKIRHAKYLIQVAKARARKFKIPFSIIYLDIPIPDFCPILNIKLLKNNKTSFNSATVDRIVPKLGYIKDNVIVISCKANQIKNNGTFDEILKVGNFFKNIMEKGMSPEGKQKLKSLLVRHEKYEQFPYTDVTGHLTIGIGRNLSDRGISTTEAFQLLDDDIFYFSSKLSHFLNFFNQLSENRQIALIDMCFNLGVQGFLGFKEMITYLSQENYENAAQEIIMSKWAQQVGERAHCLAEIIRTGEF